ncbi:MAG: DUF1080 domain-containing protein [Planctomycetes bacterium]|nr:DUF1080 domain-containing protein [Planctomycetota bacterium]
MTPLVPAQAVLVPGDPGPSPTIGAPPPRTRDTVVLFDGTSIDKWTQRDGAPSQWMVQKDGSVQVRGGDAVTRDSFGSFQLHVEFLCPEMPEKAGQARANSGVYLHGRYEVQVLDTFGQEPFMGAAGAVYSIAPPLVNASRPAGHYQTYDIVFRAPKLGPSGDVVESAFVTVIHNGIVVQNNLELPQPTPGGIETPSLATGPILLQDHGDPIRYRNMWIRRLD